MEENLGPITGTRNMLYRCYKCGTPVTCLQIQKSWRTSSKEPGKSSPICSCGSNHISPTNAKLWEELTNPHIWRIWWHFVFKPWLKQRFA